MACHAPTALWANQGCEVNDLSISKEYNALFDRISDISKSLKKTWKRNLRTKQETVFFTQNSIFGPLSWTFIGLALVGGEGLALV